MLVTDIRIWYTDGVCSGRGLCDVCLFPNKGISVVISSPFLRCLQTAQEACRAIGLPGIVINNSICEVLSPGSKMRTSPVVPASDITSYGISILEYDEKPLPQFPETTFKAIER